jgi:hypothetical protein
MRGMMLAFAVFAVACSPATTTEAPQPPAAPSADATTQALVAALTPLVAQELGQAVSLQVSDSNVRDEWAFVTAQPRRPDGSAIDWSTTTLAERAAQGVLGSDGATYALLKNENGVWTVLEYSIGPTDVAWIEWAAEHGVPPDILGLPSN